MPLEFSPSGSIDLGTVNAGAQQTVQVDATNTGETDEVIEGASVTGADADLALVDNLPSSGTIPPGGSEPVRIRFTPTEVGEVAIGASINTGSGANVLSISANVQVALGSLRPHVIVSPMLGDESDLEGMIL